MASRVVTRVSWSRMNGFLTPMGFLLFLPDKNMMRAGHSTSLGCS